MSKIVAYKNGELVEYEILKLVDFYDPILKTPTIPYDFKSVDRTKYLLYTMMESLEKYEGLGLSANQLGLTERICAINMGEHIWIMFNPYIIDRGTELSKFSEGCLSYPGLFVEVPRPNHIKVEFQDAFGKKVEQEFDGLTSVIIQHELDHLDGILFTDRISPIKFDQAKRKVKKTLKRMKRATIPTELPNIPVENEGNP